MNVKTITFKVKGVTFDGRQGIIAHLKGNEPCRIEPEPTNNYDKNALAVIVILDGKREHVGYVPKELAAEIAPKLSGENVMAQIEMKTGGFTAWDGSQGSYGLIVVFQYPEEENIVIRDNAHFTDFADSD